MSLLFPSRTEERATYRIPNEFLLRGDGKRIHVNADSAMRQDAVWGCVTRISQDLAQLPPDAFYRVGGTKREVSPTPQIIAAPSVNAKPLDWRYQVLASWLTAGNAWGLVTQTDRTMEFAQRIELLSPSDVRVDQTSGRTRYYVNNVEHDLWPLGDLWHEPAYTMPGHTLGLSPIAYHAASIGIGLTAQRYGADFLEAGGPTALVQPEGQLDEPQAIKLKNRLMNLTRGTREPLVLPASTKYTPIQINPAESQFLDTMRYSSEQIIGRVYLEDPADYGLSLGGKGITYANRVDADLARFKRRQFWVTKLQSVLTDLLPGPQFVKLNTNAALMMTPKERHEVHALRLKSEATFVNEVRDIEDEPRFDDPKFDQPGIPDLLKPSAPVTGETQ